MLKSAAVVSELVHRDRSPSTLLRTLLSMVSAVLLWAAPAARAGILSPCNGGNCPAANLIVTGITTPRSAGTAGSVTVEVRTSNGSRATGYTGTVHFTSTDAQALLPADYTFTSSTADVPNCSSNCDQGIHTFAGVTLTTAGTQSVTATDKSKSTVTGSQTGIVVTPATLSRLVLSGIPSSLTAGTASSVTVKATDSYGNLVGSYRGSVHFTSTDAAAVLPPDYTFTSTDNGTHTFTSGVTLKSVGTQSVTASDSLNGLSGSQTGITVNPGAASILMVSGVSSPRTANTASSVTATAKDAYGNVATGYTGTVKFTSSDSQATLPANCTAVSGTCTSSNLVLKTVGTQSVTGTDRNNSSITGSQTGIVVVSNAAVSLVVSGFPSPSTAGASGSLTVTARDAAGNTSTGFSGTATITSPTDPLAGSTPCTLSGGTCSVSFVLKTAGTQSIQATSGSLTPVPQTDIQVNAAATASFTVHGFPSPITAGVAGTVNMEAHDAYGNFVGNYSGTASVTSSDAQASPTTCTFTSGACSTSFTLKTVGAQTITATAGSSSGSQVNITVVAGAAASLALTGFPSPVVAGTAATLTVQARDSFGNFAPSYNGTVRFTSSDPLSTVPANTTLSGGIIVLNGGVTLRTAGSQSVSAADVNDGSIFGQQTGIVVTAAGATSLTITGSSPTTAGAAAQATVTLYDQYGNQATGYVGTLHFTSSDLLATMAPDRTFGPGDFGAAVLTGFTFRSAGTQTLTATDTQSPSLSATESNIAVAPAAAASFAVEGFPSPSDAGANGSFTVRALDSWNNLATGYRGAPSFSSTDSAAVLPTSSSFTEADAGSRTFAATLKTAGSQTITATDGPVTGSQTGISVRAGIPAALVVSNVSNPIGSGVWSSALVRAVDTYGNTANDYLGTIAFSSSDPFATVARQYTFSSGDSGIHGFTNAVQFISYGTQSLTASDINDPSITGTQSGIFVIDATPPTWPSGSMLSAAATSTTTAHLEWTAATDNVGVTAYRVYKDGVLNQTVSSLSADVTGLVMGTTSYFQVQAGDAAGNWTADGPTASATPVPPDPVLLAPALDTTVATTIGSATSFLYTGPNAIQTGVSPGTITATRAAVLRGLVRDRASQPLLGVKVSVLNHSEFGQTWSRADGKFDLAVNGGAMLTLKFERSDLLPVQRQVTPSWQDFTPIDDVVMIEYDQVVTLLSSGSAAAQVARASVSADEIGSRQATMFIPPGTTATLVMPDNSTQSLSTFHFRATEYTVGADGPRAMPGPLPRTSVYTYALAFTVDEALAAGADHVQFSQPVFGYVENFLSWPVGTIVPNGTYDRKNSRWVPESNGQVIQILSVANGSAELDTDGDGQPDTPAQLAALSISSAELVDLAALYQTGQTLWRVPMLHFSDQDWNCPGMGLPLGTQPPDQVVIRPSSPQIECPGCRIDAANQALGEDVAITGTPYGLHYQSDHVAGRRAAYRMNLVIPPAMLLSQPPNMMACLPNRTPNCQASGSPPILVPLSYTVDIAGKTYSQTNSDTTNPLPWAFEWDGTDRYGRTLQGQQTGTITACYHPPGVWYANPGLAAASFAQPSISGALLSWRWTGDNSAVYDVCSAPSKIKLGTWNVASEALGGWTLSEHHALDVANKTVYRGDGRTQRADDLMRYVANSVFGTGMGGGSCSYIPPDGLPASTFTIGTVNGFAVGPDGTIYASMGGFLFRVTPDGLVYRVGGIGCVNGPLNDGISALQAKMDPQGLALAPDGTIFYVDLTRSIRKITPSGLVYTVAGNGSNGFTADGAVAAGSPIGLGGSAGRLSPFVSAIALGSDGSLYFPEYYSNRIRKVGPDGILRTAAGSGVANDAGGFSGDGQPATSAHLRWPQAVALSPDGSLLISDTCNNRVRRVTPDGMINTVAGSGLGLDPVWWTRSQWRVPCPA